MKVFRKLNQWLCGLWGHVLYPDDYSPLNLKPGKSVKLPAQCSHCNRRGHVEVFYGQDGSLAIVDHLD